MAQAREVPTVLLAGGVAMPLVGFGTWQLRGRSGYEAVRFALEVGYRHLDTATMYGNEAEVGRALRDSGLDRGEVFVTTKLPPGRAGRERETIAASLRALGTDYVDLSDGTTPRTVLGTRPVPTASRPARRITPPGTAVIASSA